jgi:hypothetical protein
MTSAVTPLVPWDRLRELSDIEWKALAGATLSVIRGEVGDPPLGDPALPPSQLRKRLKAALGDQDIAVAFLAEDLSPGGAHGSRECRWTRIPVQTGSRPGWGL